MTNYSENLLTFKQMLTLSTVALGLQQCKLFLHMQAECAT